MRSRLTGVELIHIGSSAIPGLLGKPVVDAAAITARSDLREEQRSFECRGFQHRAVWVDNDDKPYVCGSVRHDGRFFNVNVHICHRGDPLHTDSIAFVEILTQRADRRRRYESAKDRAHAIAPLNPEIYDRAKEGVIRAIQALRNQSC